MDKEAAYKSLTKSSNKHFQRARDRGRMPNTAGGRSLWVTEEQYETVIAAVRRVREVEEDKKMPEGVALEMIAADFLAGKGWPDD
jgi:hypothetical protein